MSALEVGPQGGGLALILLYDLAFQTCGTKHRGWSVVMNVSQPSDMRACGAILCCACGDLALARG